MLVATSSIYGTKFLSLLILAFLFLHKTNMHLTCSSVCREACRLEDTMLSGSRVRCTYVEFYRGLAGSLCVPVREKKDILIVT
jgi:hypothetical protein